MVPIDCKITNFCLYLFIRSFKLIGSLLFKDKSYEMQKTLRNSSAYRNVFISPDLTPQERASNKQLCTELQRRKAAGEPNLIIKRAWPNSLQTIPS